MSGNTDFWRNDLFTRTGHPAPGNNLFGADRLRQSAPTDVAHQHAFFGVGRWTLFRFELFEQFDGGEIVTAFLFGRADAEFVGVRDAVIALIARRLGFRRRGFFADDLSFGF